MGELSVVEMRTGQFEWRLGELGVRLDRPDTVELAVAALICLGWRTHSELGLRLSDDDVREMRDGRHLRDEQEKLRAQGRTDWTMVSRRALREQWRERGAEPAAAKPAWASPPPSTAKGSRNAKVERITRMNERRENDFVLTTTLFDDPEEQLRYEVRHAYLMMVPPGQRDQWPLDESYTMLDQFQLDVIDQEQSLSRRQIVSAIMDVVCGKAADTPSRAVRFMAAGGKAAGQDLVRRDGARAFRAKVSQGSSARRIMWWRTPSGGIELARLAVHDDVHFPDN